MHKFLSRTALATLALTIGTEAMATEWNVSLWGKRRAFTEHVEKLAELVDERTGGDFTLNISYGGLSTNRENLDGISIGAFEMAQFCAGYHPDKNPSITVLELPFLGVSSLEQEVRISRALYEHPAAVEDLLDVGREGRIGEDLSRVAGAGGTVTPSTPSEDEAQSGTRYDERGSFHFGPPVG